MLDHDSRRRLIFVRDLAIAGFAAEISEQLPIGTVCRLRIPNNMPIGALVTLSKAELVGCSFERLLSPGAFNSLL
jgi:hypothetical protein